MERSNLNPWHLYQKLAKETHSNFLCQILMQVYVNSCTNSCRIELCSVRYKKLVFRNHYVTKPPCNWCSLFLSYFRMAHKGNLQGCWLSRIFVCHQLLSSLFSFCFCCAYFSRYLFAQGRSVWKKWKKRYYILVQVRKPWQSHFWGISVVW